LLPLICHADAVEEWTEVAWLHAVTLVAGAASRRTFVDLAGADRAALDRLLAL
jgi:hypothetical protein